MFLQMMGNGVTGIGVLSSFYHKCLGALAIDESCVATCGSLANVLILFSCVQRWTQENNMIKLVDFKIAWKNTAKLGQLLLDFAYIHTYIMLIRPQDLS
eukprot:SAG31_NODE_9372_length_1289_cov_1.057143_2_plen_99_part_00